MSPREQIMQRLLAVCDAIATDYSGTLYVFRNRKSISRDEQPALILLEGDELADQDDRNKHYNAPRRVTMTPSIHISITETDSELGELMNELHALVIDAVLLDSQLKDLTLQKNGVQYIGSALGTVEGARQLGELDIGFAIPYIMRPGELSASA